jgi:ABC-type transporter lipoprotein component MlaA
LIIDPLEEFNRKLWNFFGRDSFFDLTLN